MTRLIHISDTHFGTELLPVVGALRAKIAELAPDVVVLSGDITQRARTSQFAAARAFCDSLKVPVLTVPGNHDIPLYNVVARLCWPYRTYQRFFGAREWIKICGDIAIVGFDATHPLRHTRGKLDARHVEHRMKAARETAPDAMLIAVVHQPVMVSWPEDTDEILIDAPAVADVLMRYGVSAVLSGHVHVPVLARSSVVFDHSIPGFLHSGAGTAMSWRTRPCAPNSFNILDCDANTQLIDAHIYVYDHERSSFQPAE